MLGFWSSLPFSLPFVVAALLFRRSTAFVIAVIVVVIVVVVVVEERRLISKQKRGQTKKKKVDKSRGVAAERGNVRQTPGRGKEHELNSASSQYRVRVVAK